MTDPGEERELVALEPHPRPSAVSEAATRQLALDVVLGDVEPGRQALDDDDEAAAVRLTSGQEAEHGSIVRPVAGAGALLARALLAGALLAGALLEGLFAHAQLEGAVPEEEVAALLA